MRNHAPATLPTARAAATDDPTVPAVGTDLHARLAAFAGGQLQRALAELARPRRQLHEGIHEARKALRRTQAALRLGHRAHAAPARALERELREIGRSLSPLRDAQALVEVLARHAAQPDADQATLRIALDGAMHHRDALLDRHLEADPALRARRRRIERAARALRVLDWRDGSALDVLGALARSDAKVRSARHRLDRDCDDDEQWHRLRRRIRRFKQQSALLAELSPELGALVGHDDAVARILGEAQDEFLLLCACAHGSPFAAMQRRRLQRSAQQRLQQLREAYRAMPVQPASAVIHAK